MSLTDDLIAASASLPAPLQLQEDGSLAGEALLAERKAFLSKKKLTYECEARVDGAAHTGDFAAVRNALGGVAEAQGYGIATVLNPKSV